MRCGAEVTIEEVSRPVMRLPLINTPTLYLEDRRLLACVNYSDAGHGAESPSAANPPRTAIATQSAVGRSLRRKPMAAPRGAAIALV
jgi:hypothetical protein